MLLSNIRTVDSAMMIICNAGAISVTQMGTFDRYEDVSHHPEAIANIVTLNRVQKLYHVTYGNRDGDRFLVHLSNGTARAFLPTKKGLHALQII